MPLQETGPISIQDIANEFGGSTPHSLSEYYAGGANVPGGTEGINGPIPSSGTTSLNDFFGASLSLEGFSFLSEEVPGLIGVHTMSIGPPRFGTWLSPLPEIIVGTAVDGNGVRDTITQPILFPDGFTYGSGTIQTSPFLGDAQISLSLTRHDGVSPTASNLSWVPFNNMIINGPGYPGTIIPFGSFLSPPLLLDFEFFLLTDPVLITIPEFIDVSTYVVTFT